MSHRCATHSCFERERIRLVRCTTYKRLLVLAFLSLFCSLVWTATARAKDKNAVTKGGVRPQWSRAVLRVGERTIDVHRDRDGWAFERVLGDKLLRISKTAMEVVELSTLDRQWQSEIAPSNKLTFLAEQAGILYLSAEAAETEGLKKVEPSSLVIRRFKITDGTPLGDLSIPVSKEERGTELRHRVAAAVPVDDGVVFLSMAEKPVIFVGDFPVSYRVTKFADALVWSETFTSAGAPPAPKASVLGSVGPARDSAGIQRLSRFGSHVLVCAGPMDDVIAMNPKSGKIDWKIPRIWEYRKGFVGPSVWRYCIGRYGIEDRNVKRGLMTREEIEAEAAENGESVDKATMDYYAELKETVQKAKNKVEREPCTIVAGPVIVPNHSDRRRDCFFLATSRSASGAWPGYLSECVIYEVDLSGKVLGTVTLPRFIQGRDFQVTDRGVTWCCREDNVVRLFPSNVTGNADLVTDMDWRVNRQERVRTGWLTQGLWYRAPAFRGRFLLRPRGGGFVESAWADVFNYPLVLIDSATNEQHELMLNLPFQGQIVEPPNKGASLEGGMFAREEFLMTIRDIEFIGDTAVFTFKFDDGKHVLEFDLSGVLQSE